MDMVKDRVNYTNHTNYAGGDDYVTYTNYTDEDDYVTKNYKPHMGYPFNETSSATKKSGYTVIKIRPKAELYHSDGNDGWDAYDDIRYRCPTCNRLIGVYKSETACDKCGTFYDWGDRPARIVITKSIQWD